MGKNVTFKSKIILHSFNFYLGISVLQKFYLDEIHISHNMNTFIDIICSYLVHRLSYE